MLQQITFPNKIVFTAELHGLISGFRYEVDENCAFLGYYVASIGNFLPTFRDNLSVQSSGAKILDPEDGIILIPEYGTDRLSRNVGKKLPLLAA